MRHILCVAGARPNFMKIAPILRECLSYPDLRCTLVHTGQHYDDKLSTIFFEELSIPRPDVNLNIGSAPRDAQIPNIMRAFEPVLRGGSYDLVLVVGDVNSTLACAKVAHQFGVKVAHVEAGLRSFDLGMIEEHNRLETDAISDYLFVTEPAGLKNLEQENTKGKVFFVGNVMIDTLAANLGRAEASKAVQEMSLVGKEFVVTTFHRPSNVDSKESLLKLLETLEAVSMRTRLVFPLHPRTKNSLERHSLFERLERIAGIVLCEPLGYLDFIQLVSQARAVITDSGGIQEETTYLQVPCITMRENTERPVTVTEGTNVLVGSDCNLVIEALDSIRNGTFKKGRVPELWDGHAAKRIVDIIYAELEVKSSD